MRRSALLPLALVGLYAACTDGPQSPFAPQRSDGPAAPPSFSFVGGPGPTGAIFTTTPDGGIVNANTKYEAKIEVYLDGGPRDNAPQHAAALDDGMYVFQITDPSGKYLLSSDPAKCRIFEVVDGVIHHLVAPSTLGLGLTDSYKPLGSKPSDAAVSCHVSDDAPHPTNPGVAGASGRHDTNVDRDHGADGAIVVQMMPFWDTPNPGGVYKAWITPLATYRDRSGDLATIRPTVKGRDAQPCPQLCLSADPGFGPPRSVQKTDNFKIKEAPPFLEIRKYDDLDGDGTKDAGEPEIAGWLVTVGEPVFDGTEITNAYYTPATLAVAPNVAVKVCEEVRPGWAFSYLLVDGVDRTGDATSTSAGGIDFKCVTVSVGSGPVTIAIGFGNWAYGEKSGYKFYDPNANALWDSDEPGLAGWEIKLFGTDGKGNAVSRTEYTGADPLGKYAFDDLAPGTYTVCEVLKTDKPWAQTFPSAADPVSGFVSCAGYGATYGPFGHRFTLQSGGVHANNNFGNRDKFHGCTPGYWKQEQHFGNWTGYTREQLVSAVFVEYDGQGGYGLGLTLLGALGLDNSTGIGQVLRHGTAALLNAANGDVTYPLTEDGVKKVVNDALVAYDANDQAAVDAAHARLAGFNESSELGCPLGRADLP